MRTLAIIVEDDASTRSILASMCKDCGVKAICCDDGELAWRLLNLNPGIGFVITDMVMDGLDGRELIERIRAHPDLKDLPVLMVSAVIGPKAISDLLAIGVTAFLPKPIKIDDFRCYVQRMLDLIAECG